MPVTKRYRSAATGQFVSEAYAKKHPRTTIAERDKGRTKNLKKKKW